MGRASRVRRRTEQVRRSVAVAVLVGGSAVVGGSRADPPGGQVVEVVSLNDAGTEFDDPAGSPAISSLGDRVGFSVDLVPGVAGTTAAFVRDRLASRTALAPPAADAFAMNGDGCVVVTTNTVDMSTSRNARVYDVCRRQSFDLRFPVNSGVPLQPAIDRAGSVVAVPHGGSVSIQRSSDGFGSVQEIATGGHYTFEAALSGNGARVAAITDAAIIIGLRQSTATLLQVAPIGATSMTEVPGVVDPDSISWSDDGRWLAFSDSTGARLYDSSTGQVLPVVVGGGDANISRDGRYVVSVDGRVGAVVSWRTSDSWTGPIASAPVSDTIFMSDPVISEHGRWVAGVTSPAAAFRFAPLVTQVVVHERRPILALGSTAFGQVAGEAERDVSIQNTGPSGWRVTAVEADGGFSVLGHDCPAVLHPGATCTARVAFDPAPGTSLSGTLRVSDTSYPGVPLVTAGALSVSRPGPDRPPDDDPPVNDPPADDDPPVNDPPDDDPPDDDGGSGPPVRPDVDLSLSPRPAEFGPLIVGEESEADITLANTGDGDVTIIELSILGRDADDFTVVDDDCDGTVLAPGAQCVVTLSLVPSDAGDRVATLEVIGSGGATASARLLGSAVYDARLEVDPATVVPGQVVRISGSGYPPADTIGLNVGGSPLEAGTGPGGSFDLDVVVLHGVPAGPTTVDDIAEPDRYDAEIVDLLIELPESKPYGNGHADQANRPRSQR